MAVDSNDVSLTSATILNSLSEDRTLQEALERVLVRIQPDLGFSACALIRSTPPEWEVLAGTGSFEQQAVQEVAAEALDAGRTVESAVGLAAPVSDCEAIVLLGRVNREAFQRVLGPIVQGLALGKRMHERVRRIRRLEKILEITTQWGQSDSLQSLLHAMAEAATELVEADRASIFLWDRPNRQLVARPALGLSDEELRLPDDKGIVGQVVQSRQPRRVGRGPGEEEIDRSVDSATGYTTETLLCVPLVTPEGRALGAFEVLNKRHGPFTKEDERELIELASHAAVALENTQQMAELLSTHQMLVDEAAEGVRLIGESPAVDAVRSTVRRIAPTDLAILILGENGTGKEVVARSIHYLSDRRDRPFVAVNCAALTETLLESELFGHEKGAFTDARETRPGKFELASGGTLLLDEIGDMSLSGQAKLLRVLEEKTVVRVGGSTPIHTEVRVLAATNQDLAAMVRERRFREDLFFRLNVVSLELPPLRDRGDDVLLLAEHFLGEFCRRMGRRPPRLTGVTRQRLLEHTWPGNVRELRNLFERLAYLTSGDEIVPADLAFIDTGASGDEVRMPTGATLADATHDFQESYIRHMISRTNGNMSAAAKRLGLHRSNLYRKMKQLGMEDPGADDE